MFWRLNQTYFAAALTTTFMLLVPAQSANAQTQELSPAFEQPNIANTLRDYLSGRPLAEKLRIRRTDELLRPPFASKPTDSVKGLAAKIRAEELDVCNRVKAAEYLGTVDCKAYPEAQEMLIDTLHNDKYELVRLAAARALGVMLSCRPQEAKIMMCDPNYQPTADCPMKPHGRYQAPWEKSNKRFVSGLDACPGCCNADVLNALAKTAYESNEDGCCFEPSARVRQMAAWAMSQCGVCCREQAEQIIHEKKTEDKEEEKKGEVDPNKSKEVDPTRADENDGKEGSSNGESTSTPRPFLFPPAAAMVPPSPAGTA
ncbi:MAG: HEAT repeat domain-containing protein, partial [Planctomycetaceae bacterium]|nr:HEAT repeat domain-containing protein [Planctomycetaceae bacterium]